MNIVSNKKMIRSRSLIGQITTFGSLAVLGLGLYLSFQENMLSWALLSLIIGFILSQVGIFIGGRFGRSPRPDEIVTSSLKGLDGKYTLYHYVTATPHLLVGPSGVWNVFTYHQGGTIKYDPKKGRWVQKGGNLYLKLFAQENLGRPDLDIQSYNNDLQKFLKKVLPDQYDKVEVKPLLLFTNPKVKLEIENCPVPSLKPDKVKDFMRRNAKTDAADVAVIKALQAVLPAEDILPKKK
ncbi:MAG: NERD domain-containing protein [Anaerolineae bacterium]|nr:NERD domain-containing protein [Anaerolineae bacterium]